MSATRLWVGGFTRRVEKEEVTAEFQEYGKIVDIWIAFDPPGYCFVEFETEAEAQAAIDGKHQQMCLGCKVQVQKSKKSGFLGKLEWEQSTKDKNKGNRLYIGNIKDKINIGTLNGAFEEFGSIVDISVGKEGGYAFIEYETDEAAQRAIEETNGTEIFGGFLEVEITSHKGNDQPHYKKFGADAEQTGGGGTYNKVKTTMEKPPSSRIFVGNLCREVTKEELTTVFEGYGALKEVWIPYTYKGYCFIEYEEDTAANAAVEGQNGSEHDFSQALKVEITARKKSDNRVDRAKESNITTPRLFIGNIKEEIDKKELQAIFEAHGTIVDVWVAYNPPGFAFVEYDNMESAQNAIQAFHGQEMFGGRLKVDLTASSSKNHDRPAYGRGRSRPFQKHHPHPYARPPPAHARRPPPFRSLRGRAPPSRPHYPVARRARPISRPAYYDSYYEDAYYDDPYYAAETVYAAEDPYYAAAPVAAPAPRDPYYHDEPYYKPDPLSMRASDAAGAVPRGRGRGARARPPPPPAAAQIPPSDDFY